MTRARDLADFNFDGKAVTINESSADLDFRVESDNLDDALFVQGSDGIVGVGTKTPAVASGYGMQIHNDSSAQTRLVMTNSDTGSAGTDGFQIVVHTDTGAILELRESADLRFATGATERMRLASDGDLLIGKASDTFATDGTALKSTGEVNFTRTDAVPISLRRSGTAGNLIEFYHDSTTVGKIGIQSSGFFIDGESGHEGIRFANGSITPRENGSDSDGASDLGASNNRFKDGYFSNIVYSRYLRGQNDTDTGIDVGNTGTANTLVFHTGGSERARIDSAGHLLIATGGGTQPSSSRSGVMIKDTSAGAFTSFSDTTNTSSHGVYGNTNGVVGSIQTTNSSTAFNTSSDYRLKENVEYGWDATSRLKQLKPARFNFIANADITVDGFLAHEVSSIVPEAITGTKDETRDVTDAVLSSDGKLIGENIAKDDWAAGKLETKDAEGNSVDSIYPSDSTWTASHTEPVLQQIDQSKLVPLLVKTILELEARVATLEAS